MRTSPHMPTRTHTANEIRATAITAVMVSCDILFLFIIFYFSSSFQNKRKDMIFFLNCQTTILQISQTTGRAALILSNEHRKVCVYTSQHVRSSPCYIPIRAKVLGSLNARITKVVRSNSYDILRMFIVTF